MKVIGWIIVTATLVVALAYMVISLNRWEWNRALFFGLIVLMAEIALATALILNKLSRNAGRSETDREIVQILRETRSPRPNRFAWLDPAEGRTNVFITFLIGGGIILSGLAWLVDRIAAQTATPAGEELLARRLGRISYPTGGLLVDDVTVLAQAVPGCSDDQLRVLLRRAGQHEK